jgi:RNA polymerase sigma-70 factor (ECF subfamily)
MTAPDPHSLIPTRCSLLSRLKDWENQDSWREFFNTYWRLIYSVARKAGLQEDEAQDVVQDTITTVAKEMKNFRYDRSKGSFKGWLKVITKRRVADSLRRRYRSGARKNVSADAAVVQAGMAQMQVPEAEVIEQLWEDEWRQRVLEAAIERVKATISPAQFQIFELFELKQCPIREVTSALNLSRVAVYVACHRVKKMLKSEVRKLERRMPV